MRPIQRLAVVAALVASAPTALAWESQGETPPETTLAIDGRRTSRLVGRTVIRRDGEPIPGTHPAQFRISPSTGPRGEGVGLTASLQF